MMEEYCQNCGVLIIEDARNRGLHPVQELYEDSDGRWCEACWFQAPDGEYHNTGEAIVKASLVDADDEVLADLLAIEMEAMTLRRWMSSRGLTRSRGSRKRESAAQAVEQDPVLVTCTLIERGAIETDRDPKCKYYLACGNETSGPREEVCDECIDVARRNRRFEYDDFDTMTDYMRRLHEVYA